MFTLELGQKSGYKTTAANVGFEIAKNNNKSKIINKTGD